MSPTRDFTVGDSPTSLLVWGTDLVWTDAAGAIWSMPADGRGTPTELSNQQAPDFAFKLFRAGEHVFATSRGDLLRVATSHGPVTKAKITGLADYPIDAGGDATHVYLTMFKRPEIVSAPVTGGAARKIADLPYGVLALHGGTLYVASYATGTLIAIPTPSGKQRTIAKGLVRITALAADDTAVFAYSEKQKQLMRIDLATGKQTVLARDLDNSDDLVSDGAWLYTFSWGKTHTLVRVAKDGSRPPEVLADELKSPYKIVVDAEWIYVTSRDQDKIVKLRKR